MVSSVSISAAEGAGPASSTGLMERRVLSSWRASGIGLIRGAGNAADLKDGRILRLH